MLPIWSKVLALPLTAQTCSCLVNYSLSVRHSVLQSLSAGCWWLTTGPHLQPCPVLKGRSSTKVMPLSWGQPTSNAWLMWGYRELLPLIWFGTALKGYLRSGAPLGRTEGSVAVALKFTFSFGSIMPPSVLDRSRPSAHRLCLRIWASAKTDTFIEPQGTSMTSLYS